MCRKLCYVGSRQPASTGRWPEEIRTSLANTGHGVSVSSRPTQEQKLRELFPLPPLALGEELSCCLAQASFSPWHRL